MKSESALSRVLRETTLAALHGGETHDAIVVGGGAAGGFAAMLLAESGLRVLVLDAGLPRSRLHAPIRRLTGNLVRRFATSERMNSIPAPLIPRARNVMRRLGRRRQPIQSQCYAWEREPAAFVDDIECPYVTLPGHPFTWIRVRGLGGRIAVPGHGRQYYRFGPDDFSPPDGLSVPWPLRNGELDPWYALVEQKLGLSGTEDGIPWLPDSVISKRLDPTVLETNLRDKVQTRWPGSTAILARYAAPLETLEAAARTGRLRCRQGAVVREVHVDAGGAVTGVSWIDHQTRTEHRSFAPVVFLCASALESTRLLLLSRSPRSPQGLGTNSGVLGRFLMDHVYVKAEGVAPWTSGEDAPEDGRCLFLPRFDARTTGAASTGRGFGVQLFQFPAGGGQSYFIAASFGEMLPRAENQVTLDPNQCDAWGIPALNIDCKFGEIELATARAQTEAVRELACIAGAQLTAIDEMPRPPGSAYHECGTARMGVDPADSVLDINNQCWEARGLYVTDGACFPSQGFQNPTLTILALTARACEHALSRSNSAPLVTSRSAPFEATAIR